MTLDGGFVAQTISSVASLLWPLIIILILVVFRRPLMRIVRSAEYREWTLEVGGQKLSMKQLSEQQNGMIADLQMQLGELRQSIGSAGQVRTKELIPASRQDERPRRPDSEPTNTSVARGRVDARAHSVLWVDDHPENNALLLDELQRNGVRVDLARSTQDGLALLAERRYGLIISDMGRFEDGHEVSDAGIRLVKAVRERDADIPFLIYASASANRRYGQQALDAGATVMTSSPTVVSTQLHLLDLV